MDDFNSLLLQEQVELLKAQSARTRSARSAHRTEALGYARRIEAHAFPYRSLAADGSRLFDPRIYDYLIEETAH